MGRASRLQRGRQQLEGGDNNGGECNSNNGKCNGDKDHKNLASEGAVLVYAFLPPRPLLHSQWDHVNERLVPSHRAFGGNNDNNVGQRCNL